MTELPCCLNIVVAHQFEAEPLIDCLGLMPGKSKHGLTIYGNERGLSLIISGMGQSAAQAATARLARHHSETTRGRAAWLNFGIAGHRSAEIGTTVLANKISERASGAAVYPAVLLKSLPSSAVITVAAPELDYVEDAAFDMEAFGFWSAAVQCGSLELIQVCKLISDNPSRPANRVDLATLKDFVYSCTEPVKQVVAEMLSLSEEFNRIYQDPAEFARINKRYRLSVTQQHQLRALCRRFHALNKDAQLGELVGSKAVSGTQLLRNLEACLAAEWPSRSG